MVLSVQPASRDLMNKKSRPVDEGLFTKGSASRWCVMLACHCWLTSAQPQEP
jgi:magnesium-transporting ATPase (P-type)